MFALLAALLPLVQALGIPAVTGTLSALTITNWLTIAIDIAHAEPVLVSALKSLHPALSAFITEIEGGGNHDVAAASILLKLRAPQTIAGYQADGSVGPIPNPDAKGVKS